MKKITVHFGNYQSALKNHLMPGYNLEVISWGTETEEEMIEKVLGICSDTDRKSGNFFTNIELVLHMFRLAVYRDVITSDQIKFFEYFGEACKEITINQEGHWESGYPENIHMTEDILLEML